MELLLDLKNAKLTDAIETWTKYRYHVTFHPNEDIKEIWHAFFPNISSASYLPTIKRAAKYIHKATFKQVGHLDVEANYWEVFEAEYSQLLIQGYIIGAMVYDIKPSGTNDINHYLEDAYTYIQTCPEEKYDKIFEFFNVLIEKDNLLFKVIGNQLLNYFSQLGKNMDSPKTTLLMTKLSVIGYIQSFLMASNQKRDLNNI